MKVSHQTESYVVVLQTNMKNIKQAVAKITRPTWQKIADEQVRHLWSCDTKGCSKLGEQISVDPSAYANAGTPICSECSNDLAYHGTEILVTR